MLCIAHVCRGGGGSDGAAARRRAAQLPLTDAAAHFSRGTREG